VPLPLLYTYSPVSTAYWPFSHWTRTLQCLQKEMATYRHWSVSLWRDSDDVSHCRILSPDKTEWRLISATLCGWRCCFMADQLWLMTHIREEEDWPGMFVAVYSLHSVLTSWRLVVHACVQHRLSPRPCFLQPCDVQCELIFMHLPSYGWYRLLPVYFHYVALSRADSGIFASYKYERILTKFGAGNYWRQQINWLYLLPRSEWLNKFHSTYGMLHLQGWRVHYTHATAEASYDCTQSSAL